MTNELTVAATQMQNAFRDLDATFGVVPGTNDIVPIPPREVIVPVVVENRAITVEDRDNDLAVARETLHRVMGKSEDALDMMMTLARTSEHPRAFEVVGQMVKNVSDVASQLIDLHKKMKELDKLSENPREAALNGGNNIETQNNIVFTGTAEDLLDAMAARKERDASMVIENGS
jgi:hypothetical protein